LGAEHLDPDTHGRFDLIFSANVVEHIQPLGAAIGALSRVLAPGGVMRHVCPNYHFPYEPHLAIPLVPFAPKLTCHVLSSKIASNGHIWRTLNFVTATRMRRLARANGLDIEFEKGVMGRFFGRLREDPVFARRHRGLLTSIAKTTVVGPLIESFLRAIPPMAATPMIMTLKHVTPRTTV
jgi:SAM-dependent methyltransferase